MQDVLNNDELKYNILMDLNTVAPYNYYMFEYYNNLYEIAECKDFEYYIWEYFIECLFCYDDSFLTNLVSKMSFQEFVNFVKKVVEREKELPAGKKSLLSNKIDDMVIDFVRYCYSHLANEIEYYQQELRLAEDVG